MMVLRAGEDYIKENNFIIIKIKDKDSAELHMKSIGT